MPLVCATALPAFPPATAEKRLSALCARWERNLAPRVSPAQMAHCRRFAQGADALRARASRLLARLLALSALPREATLDMDEAGRPLVTGAPGWRAAFTHSGAAAFCLLCAPGEGAAASPGAPALDAEARGAASATDRAFAAPAPSPGFSLRRWVLAEALFKARGAEPPLWESVAGAAHAGTPRRLGFWQSGDARFCWRFLPAPGHVLCVAFPGEAVPPLPLRWRHWQELV